MTAAINSNIAYWDIDAQPGGTSILYSYLESLFDDNWTLNPSTFNYQLIYRPPAFVNGLLATDWSLTTPNTLVVNIRQGVHWQNLPPANGRLFTSADVVYNYDRLLGLGDGFTTPNTYDTSDASSLINLIGVQATGTYQVTFTWNINNPELILEGTQAVGAQLGGMAMINSDAVQAYGNVSNWHNAIGTGPYEVKDFVDSSSATLVENPNYWGYDERYPQNQLPYINQINFLIIPNTATALAAFRTGKIDVIEQQSMTNAQQMKQTNPSVVQIPILQAGNGITINVSNAPYNNLQVREALQEAINLPQLANTYYNGLVSSNPVTLSISTLTGWTFPYSQWPQSLKDEYTYNTTNAKALLAAAGYPNGFNTDVITTTTSDINLMEIVQSDFAAIGVTMSIQQLDPATWVSYVLRGHKEDALANRDGGPLGNNYSPIRQLELFMWGYPADFGLVNDPIVNAYYPTAVADTNLDDIQKIVQNANEYIAQNVYALSLVAPIQYSFVQPQLKGYNGQNGAIASGWGFYLARYWMTQN
jgi:peptide/nickel transport system substrate-binding protein